MAIVGTQWQRLQPAKASLLENAPLQRHLSSASVAFYLYETSTITSHFYDAYLKWAPFILLYTLSTWRNQTKTQFDKSTIKFLCKISALCVLIASLFCSEEYQNVNFWCWCILLLLLPCLLRSAKGGPMHSFLEVITTKWGETSAKVFFPCIRRGLSLFFLA